VRCLGVQEFKQTRQTMVDPKISKGEVAHMWMSKKKKKTNKQTWPYFGCCITLLCKFEAKRRICIT
jgi:hypothetical protein